LTYLMGRNGFLGRRGVKRDALRIGQAPQRICASGKRRNASRKPFRPTGGRVPLNARRVAIRLWWLAPRREPRLTSDQRNTVKQVNIKDLWYQAVESRCG
jgi:hypothetical protein